MKRSSTILFVSFLIFVLVFLATLNFLRDSTKLSGLGDHGIIFISILLIIFIVAIFIYREIENTKTINQFVTIITHKIKTPLTGIRWTIGMLQKDVTLLEKKDLLLEMQKANDRLMEIADLLVGFVRFDNNIDHNFGPASLREIINISFDKNLIMVKNKKINFVIDSSREVPEVMIDKDKIQFAVDMLVDNALKYTPDGGSINVSFDICNKNVTLKIADSGIGMSYLDSKRIFANFFRAENAKEIDAQGLGLGLFAAKKIVKHNNGKLWAESKGLNKGSIFYMQFPIKR